MSIKIDTFKMSECSVAWGCSGRKSSSAREGVAAGKSSASRLIGASRLTALALGSIPFEDGGELESALGESAARRTGGALPCATAVVAA
jgi:hypothetical protein